MLHVLTNGINLPFRFYVLPRASYEYIQYGFIPSAVWRFSNYYLQLLRCRNLASNRFFPTFHYRQVCFTVGASICPHTFICPCKLDAPHMFKHPHMSPVLPCASVGSRGYLHVIERCGPSFCLDTPMCLDTSPCVQPPCICMLPACLYVLGVICMCYGGASHVGCLGDVSTSVRVLVSVSKPLDVHYALSCTFLLGSLCLKSLLPQLQLLLLQ